MNQINVQRWASSLRNYLQSPIVTDVGVESENGVRNASTTMKIKDNESAYDNEKYSFILTDKRVQDSQRTSKSHFYTLNMTNNSEFSDNHISDRHSDTGTYIIEDEDSERKLDSESSSFKRYVNPMKTHHGTFDIHGLISSTAHTIHRPIVDSNLPKQNFSLSSSNSSLLSLNDDESVSEKKSSLQPQSAPPPPSVQNKIKPAESFVISPTFETKSFPSTNTSRRKIEAPWKSKLPTKDSNLETSTTQSISPPPSARSNQNSTEKYSFHLQKQPPPTLKTSIRPHTAINDQTSSFQRNSTPLQTPPGSRQTSFIESDETAPNLTKIYANKSFLLRQKRSNATPSTSKTFSRQPLKSLPSAPSSILNSNTHTNRAVELRRARAQAKIEELTQRSKKQLHKPNHPIDIMSASWHTNANRKDFTNLRPTGKTKIPSEKQDLSTTRTISSYRSSSASPNPLEETHEQRYQQMSASIYSIDEQRCDSLRDNGQRLAIKLIQLSSGILQKLKPNDDVSIQELEQLVEKLQTVNQTLTSIDASLTNPTINDTFV